MVKMYRQGDLLFVRMAAPPTKSDLKDTKKGDNVLVYGEATGHAHRLTEGNIWEHRWQESLQFVEVLEPETMVIHEEHGPITLSKGWWQVVRQREYDGTMSTLVHD